MHQPIGTRARACTFNANQSLTWGWWWGFERLCRARLFAEGRCPPGSVTGRANVAEVATLSKQNVMGFTLFDSP